MFLGSSGSLAGEAYGRNGRMGSCWQGFNARAWVVQRIDTYSRELYVLAALRIHNLIHAPQKIIQPRYSLCIRMRGARPSARLADRRDFSSRVAVERERVYVHAG